MPIRELWGEADAEAAIEWVHDLIRAYRRTLQDNRRTYIALRDAIRGLADGGKKKMLLNLAGVKYIDSSGIGELIANYTTVRRQGGQLKLLNLTDKIQSLLVITKLLTVFDVFEDEAEALKSFQ